jgi:hypothetical protein
MGRSFGESKSNAEIFATHTAAIEAAKHAAVGYAVVVFDSKVDQ